METLEQTVMNKGVPESQVYATGREKCVELSRTVILVSVEKPLGTLN
jgi:hypothetical protein